MKALFISIGLVAVLFLSVTTSVEAQKRKANKSKPQQPTPMNSPTPQVSEKPKEPSSTSPELKDWKTSLSAFVKHVESVRNTPAESDKVSIMDNGLYFGIMITNGGCTSKSPDDVFGPRVRFAGKFDKVAPTTDNQRNQHGLEYIVAISFPEMSPGAVVYVYPRAADLASWRNLSHNTEVRFDAELNCLIGMKFPNGVVAYSLTLKDAKVLP